METVTMEMVMATTRQGMGSR